MQSKDSQEMPDWLQFLKYKTSWEIAGNFSSNPDSS